MTREQAEGFHAVHKKLAESIEANILHGSDSDENAGIEIAYFFRPEEIVA